MILSKGNQCFHSGWLVVLKWWSIVIVTGKVIIHTMAISLTSTTTSVVRLPWLILFLMTSRFMELGLVAVHQSYVALWFTTSGIVCSHAPSPKMRYSMEGSLMDTLPWQLTDGQTLSFSTHWWLPAWDERLSVWLGVRSTSHEGYKQQQWLETWRYQPMHCVAG